METLESRIFFFMVVENLICNKFFHIVYKNKIHYSALKIVNFQLKNKNKIEQE